MGSVAGKTVRGSCGPYGAGKCQIHGAFFLDLKAAEYSGKMLVYIPDSWNNNDPVVVMASPCSMTEETFLLKYGICEFVEKQGVLTAVIRSEKEKDKTAALVNAAYKKVAGPGILCCYAGLLLRNGI